ncbi:TIGR03089 family protein [Luteipulveratus mongoliensis]|uniref:TIGR03089 family protein n=1 Tax=Luteipulveratus mongoliensis TaxID=571913 RepID=A0A0K1JHM7_9MICO|nr:TIGR03089 family protein [Luteipulveratus mongoliensis]AKU16196.1 hypothetical protein VV02_10530 [Luteipulveratus mongoliensis]
MTPSGVLLAMLRRDATRPRVTYYDDAPGPTQGERIELSAKVLANWVAKAGNLLQDELDVEPGGVVVLDLPAHHWRTLYWALAAWSVGATVSVVADPEAEVVVTTSPSASSSAEQVVVTLAALARRADQSVPAGAIDEAHELATYGDQLTPHGEPASTDVALRSATGETSYADLVAVASDEAGRRAYVTGDLEQVLRETLATWADDGSVVLVREPDQARLDARLTTEGVTRTASPPV